MSGTAKLWLWFHRTASPAYFYTLAGLLLPWCAVATVLLLLSGLAGGLVFAPADYQQGDGFRIIYVHAPSAWMSMFVYMVIAVTSAIFLIWHIKLADIVARASAVIGASFTFMALATGAIWGKPMWGTWWVWDARLTSELLLLFLYLGYIGLRAAIDDRRAAGKAASILALVGVINIPIIHYSVDWWNTLHQPATISKFDNPSIETSMLIPLLCMALAFKLFYVCVLLINARSELLEQEKRTQWVKELVQGS
ncbi:MAG: heme ABC transporter permease [Thiotrichales bacterium]|nr:heme ABC transporter permease [Thiotrichales bacterium]